MRSPVRALIPVGLVAAAILAAACTPPPSRRSTPAPRRRHQPADHAHDDDHDRRDRAAPPLLRRRPINRWGQDGIAYSVDIQGNIVYVGGDFSHAVKGKQSVARANVMAVQRNTGDLLPGFVANTNGIVHVGALRRGLRLHRWRVHDRQRRGRQPRLAKLDAATGAVDHGFHASTPNFVSDLLLVGSTSSTSSASSAR